MSQLSLSLTIIGMGLVTFATRYSFIGLGERVYLPEGLRRGLSYVPASVLSAIVLPEIFVKQGQLNLALSNPYLISALAAIVAAWYTKHVLVTLAVGMLTLWSVSIWL
jgi:branched-subunit amino acid transport protein